MTMIEPRWRSLKYYYKRFCVSKGLHVLSRGDFTLTWLNQTSHLAGKEHGSEDKACKSQRRLGGLLPHWLVVKVPELKPCKWARHSAKMDKKMSLPKMGRPQTALSLTKMNYILNLTTTRSVPPTCKSLPALSLWWTVWINPKGTKTKALIPETTRLQVLNLSMSRQSLRHLCPAEIPLK